MARRAWAATLAAGGLLALTGCGNPFSSGNSYDAYCSALQQDQTTFAEMLGNGSATALLTNLPMLRDLGSKSPPDIAADWQIFITAIEGLQKALQGAGVDPATYNAHKPPAGLSPAHKAAIVAAADQLGSSQTVQAAGDLDQEARDVCKLNLGL